ncbi:hypothetical protein MPER_07938 [Moniliophthora perniciosa FA553]|nr:hypothetical protein MPER_07938 [Moniliophthora perniciosa FA553]
MSETLLAILFVTSSAKGSNLVFRWPPCPEVPLKLSRAPPEGQGNILDPSYKRRVSSSTNEPSPSTNDSTDSLNCRKEYEEVFGYSSEFLAGILCPHASMCHQKFELVVDDLAFIGHPVCAEAGGIWRFKQQEKPKRTKKRF